MYWFFWKADFVIQKPNILYKDRVELDNKKGSILIKFLGNKEF